MAFEYIDPDALAQDFNAALKFVKPLHEPFEEYERIARNRPHQGIAKDLPKVTDGTLASIIQEKPKRIIQQIPTGLVRADDEWLELVSRHILTHEILPNADEEAKLIAKCWAGVSKAMTYGGQPAYVKFLNRGEYFGTDFVLPYVKDVILEPGKVSDRAANVIYLRTWWSKTQLKALLKREDMLSKNAQERGDNYETGWNLERIQEFIDAGPAQKDVNAQTPSEKNKMLNAGFYEIVHAFQRGIGANCYSFSPRMADGENLLRTKKNPDPRGVIPIHFIYADQDLSNPLGRGAIEMSGGVQNLIDSEMQMYQYNRALMLNPPMKKRGAWSKSNAKFVPNHIIDLGSDANADIEPLAIDSTAIANFPANYGLLKSQILNLNQSGDTTSTSGDVGNPGFSKTPQGIQAQDARLGVSDNHMRKQFESWFEEITETMLNLWFAERSGTQDLTLDKDTAAKMRTIAPNAVDESDTIRINYDSETPKLRFVVDASSSNMKDNVAQTQAATEVLDIIGKYPQFDSKQGGPVNTTELLDRIVAASGLEDAEKIVVKPETPQVPQQVTPEMVQGMVQQAIQQSKTQDQKKELFENLQIKFETLPADAQGEVLKGVLASMGIEYVPGSAPLPSSVDQATKVQDAQLKAQTAQHQQAIEAGNLAIKERDQALKEVQVGHKLHQTTQDTVLKKQQFAQSVDQADKSHELAQQAQQAQDSQEKQGVANNG